MHKMEVGEKRGTRTTTKQNDAKSTVRLRCKKEGCSISNYLIFFKNTNYASLQRSQIHLKKKYFPLMKIEFLQIISVFFDVYKRNLYFWKN